MCIPIYIASFGEKLVKRRESRKNQTSHRRIRRKEKSRSLGKRERESGYYIPGNPRRFRRVSTFFRERKLAHTAFRETGHGRCAALKTSRGLGYSLPLSHSREGGIIRSLFFFSFALTTIYTLAILIIQPRSQAAALFPAHMKHIYTCDILLRGFLLLALFAFLYYTSFF